MATDEEINNRYQLEHWVSPEPQDTEHEWAYVLCLCIKRYPIGFGVLDSFLSGPDLDRRIHLIADEIASNGWLRLELRDTLSLNHSADWTSQQYQFLKHLLG
jgi:hypothetical protein